MPNNDLAIYVKYLLDQTSKTNTTKEIDTLVTNLQNKLNSIKINIGGAGLSQLVTQLNQVTQAIQKIKAPQFNFDVPTVESKKFLSAIASIENKLSTTGRTAASVWDEFGKVTINVTNTTTGLVEKFKYAWDTVNQSLIRVNRQQQDNMLSLSQLQTKYQGMISSLQNGKLGNFINSGELQSFQNSLNNIKVVDGQITAELQAQFNVMKQNAQMLKEQTNSAKTLQEQLKLTQLTFKNGFTNFEGGKVFGSLNQNTLSQYNSLKQQIQSITTSTPDAIQQLKLLGKQFDELKIKANQSFNLKNLTNEITNFKDKYTTLISGLTGKYGSLIDPAALNKFKSDLQGLSTTTPEVSNRMKQLALEFQNIKTNAINSSSALRLSQKDATSFADALGSIISKFSLWIGVSTLVMGAFHKVTEAMSYMVEQTKLFTNLQMEMTGQTLNFSEITRSAQEYAQATGTLSSEVMRAISVFGNSCPL